MAVQKRQYDEKLTKLEVQSIPPLSFQDFALKQEEGPAGIFPNPFFGKEIPSFNTTCFMLNEPTYEKIQPTISQEQPCEETLQVYLIDHVKSQECYYDRQDTLKQQDDNIKEDELVYQIYLCEQEMEDQKRKHEEKLAKVMATKIEQMKALSV